MSKTPSREEVYEEVKELGYPVLKIFDSLPPNLVSKIFRTEKMIGSEPYDHLTAAEVQLIQSVVSANNGCELWLSFHSLTLMGMSAVSEKDMDILKAGGIPETEQMNGNNGRLRVLVIAAKTAVAHKGIVLPHEYTHLKEIGIDTEGELAEILYVAAMMEGLNRIWPNYVYQGAEIEPFLMKAGPFSNTVYKDIKLDAKVDDAEVESDTVAAESQ